MGINLDQILYKGTADDFWSNPLNNLNDLATVTLQLEKGIVGDELMLVHEKHDGTYEVIPTTYDASTNTLTFKTSSFSNYAIATKLSNSAEIGGKTQVSIPKTGDNIARYILPITLGFAALTVLLAVKKKSKKTIN